MKLRPAHLVILLSCLLGTDAFAQDRVEPDVLAVRMYADWCGNCKVLDSNLEVILGDFVDAPVLFLRFDLTDEDTKKQTRLLAAQLDLDEVYETYGARTGQLVLVDARSKEVLNVLTREESSASLSEAISAALRTVP